LVNKECNLLILDDPLSAVDSKVGNYIFKNTIKGEILKDKTIILITHHIDVFKQVSNILLLEHGKIEEYGNYNELIIKENGKFKNLIEQFTIKQEQEEKKEEDIKSKLNLDEKLKNDDEVLEEIKLEDDNTNDEKNIEIKDKFKYFIEYLKGYSILIIILCFLIAICKFLLETLNDYFLTLCLTDKSFVLFIIYVSIGILISGSSLFLFLFF
jgi:ABC-type methionine transport system ATPase subunit